MIYLLGIVVCIALVFCTAFIVSYLSTKHELDKMRDQALLICSAMEGMEELSNEQEKFLTLLQHIKKEWIESSLKNNKTRSRMSQDSKELLTYDFFVKGTQHQPGFLKKDVSDNLCIPDPITLKWEEDNKHSCHAIAVLWDGIKIGYVPDALAEEVLPFINNGLYICGQIVDIKYVETGTMMYAPASLKCRIYIMKTD